MAHPSGSHWQENENWMTPPSGSHFQIKTRTGSDSHTPNQKISPFTIDSAPNPKSTTLISNITY